MYVHRWCMICSFIVSLIVISMFIHLALSCRRRRGYRHSVREPPTIDLSSVVNGREGDAANEVKVEPSLQTTPTEAVGKEEETSPLATGQCNIAIYTF